MKEDRLVFALACAAAAFGMVYFLTSALDVPLLWYDPNVGDWSFGHRPVSVAIDWFGRTLYASLAALLCGALLGGVVRKPSRESLWTAMGWAAMIFALSGALYGVALVNRRSAPEPLPPSYQPR